MSLSCPQCGNPIEQDFGVITCAACQSVLFIDMEGQIQVSTDAPADPSLQLESAPLDPVWDSPALPEPGPQAESTGDESPSPEAPEIPTWSLPEMETPLDENLSTPAQSFEAGLNEVRDFGNADQDFGALSYAIVIERIDTSDCRQKVFEALADPKFKWDPRELIQTVERGRLEISGLNPAKASVLVKRLQEVPVQIHWKQKIL